MNDLPAIRFGTVLVYLTVIASGCAHQVAVDEPDRPRPIMEHASGGKAGSGGSGGSANNSKAGAGAQAGAANSVTPIVFGTVPSSPSPNDAAGASSMTPASTPFSSGGAPSAPPSNSAGGAAPMTPPSGAGAGGSPATAAASCPDVGEVTDVDFSIPPEARPSAMGTLVWDMPVDLLPNWQLEDLQPAFESVRDERFQCDPKRPDFARRLTWLRPAVSCEARAELVSVKLAEWGYPRPFKIFAFGQPSLDVITPNSETGTMSWSWHVAAAVRVEDQAYVFDAAIEPERPLTVEEWLLRMVPDLEQVNVALCDSTAFEPSSRCFGATVPETARALDYERRNFAAEWQLQIKLGRDPEQVLGDSPPWLP